MSTIQNTANKLLIAHVHASSNPSKNNVAAANSNANGAESKKIAGSMRPSLEPESLRKLRALKERITREYEQEKREREAMESTEPIMPISLANEKSVIGINKDGSPKMWSKRDQQALPTRTQYGTGHIMVGQDPSDYLKDKLHQIKGSNNKSWQNDLEHELSAKFNEMSQLKSQNLRLREILTLREASNTRKEAKLESEIAELKNLMDDVCLDSHNHEEILAKLRNMNYEIQEKADLLKSTIEEQAEADRLALIRTYRVRIRDVKQQLANQEALNLEGAKAWISRFEMLENDRREAAGYLEVIEKENEELKRAKGEIRVMKQHQDAQRRDLTQKIALIKRENKRFEEHIARLEEQLEASSAKATTEGEKSRQVLPTYSPSSSVRRSVSRQGNNSSSGAVGVGNRLFMTTNMSRANTPGLMNATTLSTTVPLTAIPPNPSAQKQSAEEKYKADAIEKEQTEAIVKVRRVLEMIRNSLRQVRSAHIELLQERTELEIFVRKCIDDARKEIQRAVSSGSSASSSKTRDGASPPSRRKEHNAAAGVDEAILLNSYGVKERRQLVDILNSKLQLLNMLHQAMFPQKTLSDPSSIETVKIGNLRNLSTEEISQAINFDSDIDTLWKRWQTWVKTESPAAIPTTVESK